MREEYTLMLVISPALTEKDKLIDEICGLIGLSGATIDSKTDLGMKDLAYKIKGYSKGNFWQIEVKSDTPFKWKEVNLFLNREVNVIRYLVLKK